MAKSAPALSSFTGGELSPKLEGRGGLQKNREGLSELTNFVVLPQGGVTRRPGTEYLGEVKDSDDITRLIPFQFKTSDTYILEFGDQIMRVYRSGQQILTGSAKTLTAITKANPGVLTTSTSHGFSNGDEIFLSMVSSGTTIPLDSNTMNELHGRNYLVANVTSTTFTLTDLHGVAIDTTNFSTFSAGESQTVDKIFEVATPYSSSELADVNFAQSADTMYLVHPSHAIRTLTRSANNNWTFATPSLTSPPSSLNASSDNYPSVVTFFEQRLVFAATNNNPQTLFFSKNGDYTNFTVGTNADDALSYTIASNTVNEIRWMSATRVLTIGTSGGEYVLTTDSNGPITPTSTLIRKYSNYGSAKVAPVQVADVTLFLQRNQRKVREFRYVGDVDESGYSAPDMTILSEHITDGGITEFAYQQEPDSIVWCLRSDGTLLGMTYRREEQVVAWHKHVIGGYFGSPTITVANYASITAGSTVTLTKDDGTSVVFTTDAVGSGAASSALHFRPNTSNNATATLLATAINNHSDFAASATGAVVTARDSSGGALTITSSQSNFFAVTSQAQSVVESIATLPSESGEDELYLIVKRTIKGLTKRYVERLQSIDFGNSTEKGFFVDSGLAYPADWPTAGTSTTAMTGLYHLEEEVLEIMANGAAHANRTVSSGNVTLSFNATTAVMGFPYNSVMQTLRLESGSADGTSQGKPKRLHGITIRLFRSVGLDVGASSNSLETLNFRDSSMATDTAVPLFTGDKEVEFTGGFFEDDRVFIRQTQALPLTVLAVYPRLNTFDI